MLGPTMIDVKHPDKDPEPPLWRHFRQMYFDQVLLILYIRVVLFRFSTKLSLISKEARDAGRHRWEEWGTAFEKLRWDFALFTNLYQFPLLSNQQQGLEMYSLARKSMDVDELFREVQEEIQGTNDYLMQRRSQDQARISNELARTSQDQARISNDIARTSSHLSMLAAIVLPVALALSFLGMSIVPQHQNGWLEDGINWLLCWSGIKVSGPWGLFFCVLVVFFVVSIVLYKLTRFWKRIRPGGRHDPLPSC
jgi:hypothetical protein